MNSQLVDASQRRHRAHRRPFLGLSLLALIVGLPVAFSVMAQGVPADEVFKGFQPNGDLILELDGEAVDADLFFSDRAGAFLIMGSMLSSPVLVGTRTGTVETVHLMKVMKQADGSVDLRADAALETLGRFAIEGTEVHFDLKGKAAVLKPRPDLLGFQANGALKAYKPTYSKLASDYSPNARAMSALRGVDEEVRVLVYFGTWCPTCGRLVPRMLRIDDDMGESNIGFEYYGLPRDMTSDPAAEKNNIHGVPTAIVYVGGKEAARFSVQELNEPEVALQRLLSK